MELETSLLRYQGKIYATYRLGGSYVYTFHVRSAVLPSSSNGMIKRHRRLNPLPHDAFTISDIDAILAWIARLQVAIEDLTQSQD